MSIQFRRFLARLMETRKKGFLITGVVGWISRLITAFCQIALLPLLLSGLGVDGYATYVVLVLMGGWFGICDIGISNALQNITSKSLAVETGREQKEGYFFALAAILLIVFIFSLALWLISQDSQSLNKFQIESFTFLFESNAVTMACILFILIGIGNIGQKILFATSKGWVFHIISSITQILGVVLTYFFISKVVDHDRVKYALIFNYAPMALIMALITSAILVGGCSLPKENIISKLFIFLKSCLKFFSFSFVAQSILGIDLFVLSTLKNAQNLADYSMAQKVSLIPLAFYQVVLAAWWPEVTRNWFNGKVECQIRSLKRNIAIGITLCTVNWLIFSNNLFSINWYLFKSNENIDSSLWMLFFFYVLIRVWTDAFATSLLAIDMVSIVTKTAIIQAIFSMPLQIILGSHYGSHGIIIGIILSFLLTVSWALPYNFLWQVKNAGNEKKGKLNL